MRRPDGARRSARALPILPDRGIEPAVPAALEQITQLLEGSVDAAVVLDRDRRIVYFNRGYEVASLLSGGRLRHAMQQGARCFEVMPLSVCERACVGCRATEIGRPVRLDEVPAVGPDGDERTFIVTATPFAGYIIETYRDVTADNRVQRRLKALLEAEQLAKGNLEAVISARTHELQAAQAQLVMQEKMSSLGRLVAGIAHELNNPINFVYGNVDFLGEYMNDLMSLVREIDGAELPVEVRARIDEVKRRIDYDFLVGDSRKLIDSIRAGAERTAAIVRDLKHFGRTSNGVDVQDTDVVAGIETTLNLIAPLHRNRIVIERDYQPGLPKLTCNAGHVNQVFMNLLTNAAQAIQGPGRIHIAIQTTGDAEGTLMQVTITDSGSGIPTELMQKIRDPFFTTKEVGEGTGLGLWICDNIVRAHGGALGCESKVGEGSTFTVSLPLRGVTRG